MLMMNSVYFIGTATHCCICIPGCACVERFVFLHAAMGVVLEKGLQAPPPLRPGGVPPNFYGSLSHARKSVHDLLHPSNCHSLFCGVVVRNHILIQQGRM